MYFKRFAILFLLCALAVFGVACGGQGDSEETGEGETPELPIESDVSFTELDLTGLDPDTVIATYEGGEVTGEEFARYLGFHGFINPSVPINDPENRRELVKFYILQKIIGEKSAARDWAQEAADKTWDQYAENYTEEQREEAYQKLHISEDVVREHLLSHFLTEGHFREGIDETDAQAYYDEVREQLITASVRHILISTEERQPDGTSKEIRTDEEAKKIADDLYQQLIEGADFAELAQEHTDDEGSKENGGLYENVAVMQWVPEFKEAAIEQEIGEIGKPVKTQFGYHIIRVEDRTVTEFEEIVETIYSQLANEKVFDYFTNTLPDHIVEIHIGTEESEDS